MRSLGWLCVAGVCLGVGVPALRADDGLSAVKSAVKRSTLDQKGTHPFHLKSVLTPSPGRDAKSGRNGEVEIWWQAPGEFRREVRADGFHQVQVVNGTKVWEKNEGEYFPEWLRELAEALVRPVAAESEALRGMAPDKSTSMAGAIYLHWEKPLPVNMQPEKEGVAIWENSGLLFYDGGLGWGAQFKDYADFHGRLVARTISAGSPEVTAKITVLEDLPAVDAAWFDAGAAGGDAAPLRTVVLDNTDYVADLTIPTKPEWPPVTNPPLTGVVWTELVVDRDGKVREPTKAISDNPGINGAADAYFAGLHFKPTLRDGVPVQTLRRVAIAFELHRPDGVEDLGTARAAFERGRMASTLAAAAKVPYRLKAKFKVAGATGAEEGTYEDTWQDATHWRREAVVGSSRFVRSQDGKQQYRREEGAESRLMQLVMTVLEPIPAVDTMTESDWTLKRESVAGTTAVRVLRGAEPPDGKLDVVHVGAYWFDNAGHLLQANTSGLTVTFRKPEEYDGVMVPREVVARTPAGAVGMVLTVESVTAAAGISGSTFKLAGHEWVRQFTASVR